MVRTAIGALASDRLVRFCLGLKGPASAWIRGRGGCCECDVNALHVAERGTGRGAEERLVYRWNAEREREKQRMGNDLEVNASVWFFMPQFSDDLLPVFACVVFDLNNLPR